VTAQILSKGFSEVIGFDRNQLFENVGNKLLHLLLFKIFPRFYKLLSTYSLMIHLLENWKGFYKQVNLI
jgi:hypothetical protein